MSCLDDSTVVRLLSGRLDDSLRSRVEQELARCRRCAALVAEVVRGSSMLQLEPKHEPSSPGEARDLADLAGDPRSSRYDVGAEIARGGMASIVGAFDRRLSRSIAMKLLERDDPVLARRFAREIRITASLQHPGIVPVYDSGRLPDGRQFYAMRYVQGATLEQAISGCRTTRDRLGLLASVLAVAEAVGYAHEQGVIHRDLKPSNVLVGPFGETVVIDWGLARIDRAADDTPDGPDGPDGSDPAGDPLATRRGSVLGTPRYMAPEQARGEPATCRSDVYAIGAILYHTLTGAPPIMSDDISLILERVARAEVRPLSQVAPALPGDLVAIVGRAMMNQPELRYANAGELAADLRRFQTGQLVGAYSYSRRDLVRRFVHRHRATVALAALFAIALGAGGIVSVRRVVDEGERAEFARARAEQERRGAEDLVQYLVHDLRQKLATVGRLDVLSGVADRVEGYYLTTAAGRAELPEALIERAALDDLRAAVGNAAGDAAATARYLEHGLALLDRVPWTSRSNEVRAELIGGQAGQLAQAGRFEQARARSLEAVALHRQTSSEVPEQRRRQLQNVAIRLRAAASYADRLGDTRSAEREWKEAADIFERLRSADPGDREALLRLAEIEMFVGQSRYRRGLLAEARDALRSAVVDSQALIAHEPKHERFAYVFTWSCVALADTHYALGEWAEAGRLLERAREAATAMVAIEPASATWQSALARAEMELGTVAVAASDWTIAAQHFSAARVTYEQLVTRDPRSRDHRRAAALAIAQLADAETALGHTEAARSAWHAALDHFARLATLNIPDARLEWAYGLRGYAALERSSGRLAVAHEAIERALDIVQTTPAAGDLPGLVYYRAAVLAEAGASYAANHRATEALTMWRRAAELLHGLAAHGPLASDWAKLLREVEAKLVPPAHQARPERR